MKTLKKVIVMILSLVLAAGAFAGCQGSGKSLTVTGRVMTDGTAMAGVTVAAKDGDGNAYGSVVTESDGKFKIEKVAKNVGLTITLTLNGYENKTVSVVSEDLEKQTGTMDLGDIEMTLADLSLTISGKVVSDGSPVVDVDVAAQDSKGNEYPAAKTAADGAFKITGISKTRAVTVKFSKTGYFAKEITLSIADLAEGKNAMGDVELLTPTGYEDVKGKVVGLDGETPIPGVTVAIEGFDITAVSGADGTFTLIDMPIGTESATVTFKKFGYTDISHVVSVEAMQGKDIGTVIVYSNMPSIGGSIATDFTLTRADDHFAFNVKFDRPLEGAFVQEVQLNIHVGDNVDGTVYSALLGNSHNPANIELRGTAHKVFTRKVSMLDPAKWEDPQWTDADTSKHTYEINADATEIEYKLFYDAIGSSADDTVGVCIMNPFLNGAQNAWVYPTFGTNVRTDGQNVFDYSMFYDFDKDGTYSVREYAGATVKGKITDGTDPVEGAKVQLSRGGGVTEKYEAVTAADGTFTIAGVPRFYELDMDVLKAGYLVNKSQITLSQLQNEPLNLADIALREVTEVRDLTGKIKNITGAYMEGVTVEAVGAYITAVTDSQGAFTLEGVPVDIDFQLEFTKFGYKTMRTQYDAAAVQAEPNLGDIEYYSEYTAGQQIMQFGIERTDTSIRFILRTPTTYTGFEMTWLDIQVGDKETGRIIAIALLPKDSELSTAWGITSYKPRFESPANGILWGPVADGPDDYSYTDYEAGAIIEIGFTYEDLGISKDDTIGVGIVTNWYAGQGGFLNGPIPGDLNNIPYEHFINYDKDGNFGNRA